MLDILQVGLENFAESFIFTPLLIDAIKFVRRFKHAISERPIYCYNSAFASTALTSAIRQIYTHTNPIPFRTVIGLPISWTKPLQTNLPCHTID